MVGNKASNVLARRTVAIVVGPLNVSDIAAFRGCIRPLKTFFCTSSCHHEAPVERGQ